MKKFMFIVLLLGLSVFVSYKYSRLVYINFLKIYYSRLYTENELLIKSVDMYEHKKYDELERFLTPVLIIYPGNAELKKIAAYNYMKLGNALKGAEIIAGIDVKSVEENRMLEEILKSLYYSGNYADLVYFYDRKIMLNNVNTAFYYGVSLYKNRRYDESYNCLIYSSRNTFMTPELYYYIGLNLDIKGKSGEAVQYIKKAYESDRLNKTYKKSLIEIYRKNGLYKDAELLLRSR